MESNQVLPLLLVVVVSVLAVVIFAARSGRWNAYEELRNAIARQLGLRSAADEGLVGEVDGRTVTLRSHVRGRAEIRVYVTEVAVPELPPGLALRAAAAPFATGPDETIGDRAFDEAFRVHL